MHSSRSAKPEKGIVGSQVMDTRNAAATRSICPEGSASKRKRIYRPTNTTRWSSDADALERAFELRDILEGFIGTAITEERKAKACRIPQIGSSDIDLYLIDPDLITSDELTRDDWDDLATILQILKPFCRLTLQLQCWVKEVEWGQGSQNQDRIPLEAFVD